MDYGAACEEAERMKVCAWIMTRIRLLVDFGFTGLGF